MTPASLVTSYTVQNPKPASLAICAANACAVTGTFSNVVLSDGVALPTGFAWPGT